MHPNPWTLLSPQPDGQVVGTFWLLYQHVMVPFAQRQVALYPYWHALPCYDDDGHVIAGTFERKCLLITSGN